LSKLANDVAGGVVLANVVLGGTVLGIEDTIAGRLGAAELVCALPDHLGPVRVLRAQRVVLRLLVVPAVDGVRDGVACAWLVRRCVP